MIKPGLTNRGRCQWVLVKNEDDTRAPLEAAEDNDREAREWSENDADWHGMEVDGGA